MDILDIAVAAKRGGGGGTSATIVAPAYSDMTFPISQGERCTKDGKLYEANQTISTSEAWTAAHWDETDVDEQLTELSQGKVSKPTEQTPANYVPKSDGAGGYVWSEAPGGGGGILPKVTIIAQTGSTIVMTKGSKTLTATEESGTWVFEPDELGTWTITATKSGETATAILNINIVKEYTVHIHYGNILGIRRAVDAASPAWERTDDAVGLTFSATVGSIEGHSDFDTIFPWSDISRKTIGTDTMVEIPNFYLRRYVEEGYEYIKICGHAEPDFVPAVQYGQTVPEKFYVGAYKCGAGFTSVTGVAPLANITRAAFRNGAQLKGTGWGIIDARTMCAVNYLILVETATYNSQAIIGRGYVDSNSSALANGSCDGIVTGRPAGTDGKTGVTYRGIENWWGNVWEWTDGINWNSGAYYIGNDRAAYSDDTTSGYSQLSYTGSTSWSQAYIKKFGLDTTDPAMMFPIEGGGSDSTYVCDAMWSASGWRVVKRGGHWDYASGAGSFAFSASDASSYARAHYGSRLLYISP